MTDKKEVIVKCNDNCSCMSIDKWLDEEFYYVTFYTSYTSYTLWSKLKDIWKILRGKDITTHEIVLDEEDFNKIRNF
jgi:hypothetical protein